MNTIWILVCDAAQARVFNVDMDMKSWGLVMEIDNPAGRARAQDLMGDAPGRVRQSGTSERVAMEPHTDPTVVEEERFARELAGKLQQGFDAHRFAELMLVAPPRFLGRVRSQLSAPVTKAVRGSLAKDYTSLDLETLRGRLGG